MILQAPLIFCFPAVVVASLQGRRLSWDDGHHATYRAADWSVCSTWATFKKPGVSPPSNFWVQITTVSKKGQCVLGILKGFHYFSYHLGWPTDCLVAIHPERLTAGTYSHHPFVERKMIWTKPLWLCSMLIFQGIQGSILPCYVGITINRNKDPY